MCLLNLFILNEQLKWRVDFQNTYILCMCCGNLNIHAYKYVIRMYIYNTQFVYLLVVSFNVIMHLVSPDKSQS